MSAPAVTDAKYVLGEKMDEGIPDLPNGPLDIYRKKASFSWKDMMRFLEGDKNIAFKVRMLCFYHHLFMCILYVCLGKYKFNDQCCYYSTVISMFIYIKCHNIIQHLKTNL